MAKFEKDYQEDMTPHATYECDEYEIQFVLTPACTHATVVDHDGNVVARFRRTSHKWGQ